ncbi:MAG: ABC transporter permease [Bacteroidota bacterium]
MLSNHFIVAVRNLKRNKLNAVLNVGTLALAITCCTLIYFYVSYQMNFDKHHEHSARIFRLVTEVKLDQTQYDKGSSIAMLQALKTGFSQVENASVSINRQSFVIDVDGGVRKRYREDGNVSFADAEWFKLFNYDFLSGGSSRLSQPGYVVLTKKISEKYFGKESPVGRVLSIAGQRFTVAGLITDPISTDLKADMFLSFSSFKALNPQWESGYFTDWGFGMSTHDSFILLKDAAQKNAVEKQLAGMIDKHMGKGMNKWFTFHLMPLETMHFDIRYAGTVQTSRLVVLGIIGLLILVVGSINYVNLIIAQQTRRRIEIGVRKILGGSPVQIFVQFLTGSFITTALAIVISLALIVLTLPDLNGYFFSDEPVRVTSAINLLGFAGALLILLTLIAGVYPAWIMSRSSMSKALKGNLPGSGLTFGSNSLLVIQNVVSMVLIIGTIVIILQVDYLKKTDNGFERAGVVMVPFEKISESQRMSLARRLTSLPGIESFSFCYFAPGNDTRRSATIKFDNRDWEAWPASFSIGDSAYLKTFNINIKHGRTISNGPGRIEYLVNETMAARLLPKYPEGVIGKRLWAGDAQGTIVGITRDFNLKSLRSAIEPVIFMDDKFLTRNIAVKLTGTDIQSTLAAINKQYQLTFPDQLFTYQFVDDQIAAQYRKESFQQKIIWVAALIAITISTLGLLGLVILTSVHKTKEIGIRKVLGASVSQIVIFLSSGFFKIVALSFFIASPIAWWLMNKWLQEFAYQINISWWIFALAGIIAMLVTMVTVTFQAAKAALANPVKSLHSE